MAPGFFRKAVALLAVGLSALLLGIASATPSAAVVAYTPPVQASRTVPMFNPCPPGAPPNSSLCSPAGFMVMGEFAAQGGAAAGTTVGAATITAEGVQAAYYFGGALVAGAGAWATFHQMFQSDTPEMNFILDETAAVEIEQAPAVPGWSLPGVVAADSSSAAGVFTTGSGTVYYRVVSGPTYGTTGSVTIANLCSYTAGATTGYVNVTRVNGTQGQLTYPLNCTAGQWVNSSVYIGGASYAYRVATVQWPDGQTWFAPGHPEYPTYGTEGLPSLLGTFTGTTECAAAGGLAWTVQAVAVVNGMSVTVPSTTCVGSGPGGENGVVVGNTVSQLETDGVTENVLSEYTASDEVTRIPTEFPNCLNGGAECALELWRVGAGGLTEYCGASAIGCTDWWVQVQTNPDAYQCKYGGYSVDLGYCAVYRKPGEVSPNTRVMVDPDTGQVFIAAPTVSVVPDAFPDPWPEPVIPPLPEPTPDPDPTPAPQPEPTPPAPLPDPEPYVGGQGCWSTSWGIFNPLTWVYRPIQCALTWAFVPPAAGLASTLAAGRASLEVTPPFSLVMPIPEALLGAYEGITLRCQTLPDFDPEQLGRLQLPCSPVIDGWDLWYNAFRLMVWLAAAWGLWLIVTRGFGNKDRDGGDE